MATGKVVGGTYLNSLITPAPIGSTLVIRSGLKWRKLDEVQVASWEDKPSESNTGTISAVGQAVAGAVAPRFLSKTAAAAVGAVLDTKVKPPRMVSVKWVDGKESLIKLPDSLYQHFVIMLRNKRAQEPSETTSD
ncbi:hypothetical protein GCM10027417_14110 [Glutamicibacter endophyticus]